MKFSAERAELLNAVTTLQKIVSSKTAMPVLEGILLSVEKGKLTLISYNLETGIKKEMYASCAEEGDIVINARLLSEILRKMNGVQVEIEADERLRCVIKSGEASFEIMGMAAIDFPEMPLVSEGEKIELDGKIFSEMVKGTIFAVAQIEGTRPILTGLNIRLSDNVLQVVGIDGYRLAIRRRKVNAEGNAEFIVSGRAVNEVSKIIDETTENLSIIVGKRLVSFNVNGYIFICRLLEGEFVNFEKTIPDVYTQKIYLNCRDLIDAVERVSLIINDTFSFPIRCSFEENILAVTSKTGIGRARETLPIVLEGEDFELGLNCRYLLDALKGCEDDNIQIKYNGPNTGVVIRSANDSNNDFLYLVMPMRLK